MTESIALAADAYKVNLANNIVTHMYGHVKSYFKAKNPLPLAAMAQDLHTFNIFPIMKHGCHHLQLDTTALYNLINGPLKVGSHANFKANSEQYWRNLFKIEKLETEGHKFHGSITTDGIMVSVHMRRKKKVPDEQRMDKLRKNLENDQNDQAIALDPGLVLSLAGITKNMRTDGESAIRYHSNSIRYDIGEHRRGRIYRRETNEFFIRLAADRNQLPD